MNVAFAHTITAMIGPAAIPIVEQTKKETQTNYTRRQERSDIENNRFEIFSGRVGYCIKVLEIGRLGRHGFIFSLTNIHGCGENAFKIQRRRVPT